MDFEGILIIVLWIGAMIKVLTMEDQNDYMRKG